MVPFHLPLPFILLVLLPYPPLCTSIPQPSTQEDSPLRPGSLAAAEPVLRDRPFVVVWNMPTARCHRRYGVHLDLRDFDIVQNQQQQFQGQEMTIFYRDRLGKYPYLTQDGESVNGGLPQLGDLAGHLSLAESQISNLLQPNFTGLAVIDWEEWRPLWKTDFGAKKAYRRMSKALVRQERPELSEKEVRAEARRRFHKAARDFMEETLSLGVKVRPGGLWGFYGFPYCYNEYRRETGDMYTGQCHPRARPRNDRLAWLWRQSTALYPSIYLSQEMTGTDDVRHMVKHRLLEALRVASLWRHDNNSKHATPVLPYARLAFRHTLHFLDETDLETTLGESAALGAAGVVLWGELTFAKSKRQCELLRDYIHSVLGGYIRTLRSDTQHCSLQRCRGNGRCIRRDPNSRHMISSTSNMTASDTDEIDHSSGELRPFDKHFLCHCYRGWSGERCEERKKEDEGQNRF